MTRVRREIIAVDLSAGVEKLNYSIENKLVFDDFANNYNEFKNSNGTNEKFDKDTTNLNNTSDVH